MAVSEESRDGGWEGGGAHPCRALGQAGTPSKLLPGSPRPARASPPDVRCRAWPGKQRELRGFASTGEAVGGEELAGIPGAVVRRLLVGESELTTHRG